MTIQTADDLLELVHSLLPQFLRGRCEGCQRPFIASKPGRRCLTRGCASSHIQISEPRSNTSPAEAWREIETFFVDRRHRSTQVAGLVPSSRSTNLVVAALQVLDPVVYGGEPPGKDPLVVAQPSIRLNYLNRVGEDEGFSTSFVNISTETFCTDSDAFVGAVALWLDVLGGLGLVVNDLMMISESISFEPGPYRGKYLLMNYRGVEFGEALYIESLGPLVSAGTHLIEVTVGLERLLWALNGGPNYYLGLGPLSACVRGAFRAIDASRTLTLLCMHGWQPGGRGPRAKARRVASVLYETLGRECVEDLIKHAYEMWLPFVTDAMSLEFCLASAREEFGYQWSRRICHQLGRSVPQGPERTSPGLLLELLRREGRSLDPIAEAQKRSTKVE